MFSATHVSIPVNSTVFAGLLWTVSFGLMLGATFARDGRVLAWWAILVAIAAVGCTITAVINHARKVVLDVMSWEHNLIRGETAALRGEDVTEGPQPLGVVPFLRAGAQASPDRTRAD